MKQIWKIQSTSIFCVLTLVACGLLHSDIPTDDELIQLFENNPRCFDGLRKVVETTPKLELVEISSDGQLVFEPSDKKLRNESIWKHCFEALHLKQLVVLHREEKLISLRYIIARTGLLMTGGQIKGFLYSSKPIEQNIYNNLDSFRPGGERSREITEYVDLYRNISPNWYIFYLIDY